MNNARFARVAWPLPWRAIERSKTGVQERLAEVFSIAAVRAASMYCATLLLLLSVLVVPAVGRAESAEARPPFRASEHLTLARLEQAVKDGAPAFVAARRDAQVADAEAHQARLLGNPTLDAAWGTIPVGRTNPSDLSKPLANVPNYQVGLAYTFPIKKRPERRRRADALSRGAKATLDLSVRELALSLAEVLGDLATATLRREGIGDLVAGGHRALELAEARLAAKFGTPLEVDEMRIEVHRIEHVLAAVESDIQDGLSDCAALVGVPCENFETAQAARAYVARWALPRAVVDNLEKRADLRALSAYGEAADADIALAKADRIPDPTVRVGYMHDRFVVSGNQLNSLNVSLSMPLPTFDRGQYRRQAAEATRRALGEERGRLMTAAAARRPALESRLAFARGRCARLEQEVLPSAMKVLADLQRAVENRLLPLTQVIQSRRIVSELFIEEAESCRDAFTAALDLLREYPSEGDMP